MLTPTEQSATEQRRVGLDYLEAVTSLLNRTRTIHPTAGLYEAAEPQWWWAQLLRVTDELDQLFWFDDEGLPVAATILTDWNGVTEFHPLFLPDPSAEWVLQVIHRGLDHAAASGFDRVQLEVDQSDDVLRAVLADRGFTVEEKGLTESWMAADARPPISPLHEGYRLLDRRSVLENDGVLESDGVLDDSSVAAARPHHMKNERRNHIDPEPRLRQTSLYRPELDLVVYDKNEAVAGYGLFWYNPITDVGVVEPMRTEAEHQQRGLARHLLTSGVDRLAQAGATRLKVCFEPDNEAAKHLYLSTGFKPDRENDYVAGPTAR